MAPGIWQGDIGKRKEEGYRNGKGEAEAEADAESEVEV